MTDNPILVALDFPDTEQALDLVEKLSPSRCRLKIGKELFTRGGPQFIERLHQQDFEIFLDLKFHDIPNTVAAACKAAAELGVWMVNVHALGGRKMMNAAREAIDASVHRPKLIAVTVLTSLSNEEIHEVGLRGTSLENVLRLADLAKQCGLDGVVSSAREARQLRTSMGEDFLLVTPGIRPAWAASGDQTRIMSPSEAMQAGANYLVIGRPITQAPDPLTALKQLEDELNFV